MTLTTFSPARHILLVADSEAKVRVSDVYRLLSETPREHRPLMSAWLSKARPDLRQEIADSLTDIRAEGH